MAGTGGRRDSAASNHGKREQPRRARLVETPAAGGSPRLASGRLPAGACRPFAGRARPPGFSFAGPQPPLRGVLGGRVQASALWMVPEERCLSLSPRTGATSQTLLPVDRPWPLATLVADGDAVEDSTYGM
jgi:hypothetical protein